MLKWVWIYLPSKKSHLDLVNGHFSTFLNQRLHELETETTNINHVTANQQEEDITKKKKHLDKAAYKYYCFLHGHTRNEKHTSAKCTKLIVDENFPFGRNQGKRVTAAMKRATEPGTIDGAEGCTKYCIQSLSLGLRTKCFEKSSKI